MLKPQDIRFWRAVLQTGLIDAAQLQSYWEAIPPEKRTLDAADRRLARGLVEGGLLTRWQAQQLLSGIRPQSLLFGKYVVENLVGQGGMGRVYRARDRQLNRLVALKVLSRERLNNPRALTRFQREARVGAQLQHENLVRIYDAGEEAGNHYLVMEFIDGKPVGALLARRGPLPAAIAARIACQVALGLEHARVKGLVHRDVNPMNILIDQNGTAKLTDLGLAIALEEQGVAVTRDGATVGTFDYISPEQARHSRNVDIRSDIYSLGCTLYQMLSGRPPFPQASLPQKLYAHQVLEPDPINSLVPDLPDGLIAVVRKMMAKRPEDRYPTPLEAAQDLEAYQCGPISLAGIEAVPEVPIWIDPAETTGWKLPTDSSEAALIPAGAEEGGMSRPRGERATSPPADVGVVPGSDIFGAFPPLNTGPQPPLSSSASGTDRPVRQAETRRPGAWPARFGIAVILLGIMTLLGWSAWRLRTDRMPVAQRNGQPIRELLADPPTEAAPRPDLAIRWLSDGAETAADDLQDAVRQALGKNAEIILRNAAPLVLPPEAALRVVAGSIVLRAGEESRPVVQVGRGRTQPLLQVDPKGRARLVGITFRVDTAEGEGALPPSVILSYGDLTLERCELTALGPERSPGAILARGPRTTLAGCQIAGFDRPIVIDAIGGSEHRFLDCLMVRDPATSEPKAEPWAVTASRDMLGGIQQPRRLVFQRCTITGLGLLALKGFASDALLHVEIGHCIVRSDALLSWAGPEPFPGGLRWQGEHNLYALPETPWVRLAAGTPDPSLPEPPTSLEQWRQALGSESSTQARPVRFVTESQASSGVPDDAGIHAELRGPADFVVVGEGMDGLGIDPDQLGP